MNEIAAAAPTLTESLRGDGVLSLSKYTAVRGAG